MLDIQKPLKKAIRIKKKPGGATMEV